MLPLREAPSNLQFASRAGYLWVVLAFVTAALLVSWWLRNGRFGAWLQAVRDNEDAARAVGVNPFRVKLCAIGISAAVTRESALLQRIDDGGALARPGARVHRQSLSRSFY